MFQQEVMIILKDFTLKKLHHLVILEQYCLKNILIISIAIIMDFL